MEKIFVVPHFRMTQQEMNFIIYFNVVSSVKKYQNI